jgi:hypothetical protein
LSRRILLDLVPVVFMIAAHHGPERTREDR